MEIAEIFKNIRTGDYQNENFKSFLKHVKFSFNIPSIHVAGTNGKGSTCNYISSVYRKAGLKVGLYTSPYLFKVNELIKINGNDISEDDFISIYKEFEKPIKKYELSEFEIETFIAFTYFTRQKCDVCVIECGMGGEFDATNIFTPILSIITSISLEHTSYLGRTISEIAYHKCGIIKKDIPVIVGNLNDEAMKVVNETSSYNDSKVITIVEPSNLVLTKDGYTFDYQTLKSLKIKSRASYSVNDAIIAIEAVRCLNEKFNIKDEQIIDGLFDVYIDCRMDFVKENPDILIDGSHNPEGIINLKNSLQNLNISTPIHIIFSCFRDKNLQGMLSGIGDISHSLVLTTFPHPRARGVEDYFLFADDYKYFDDPVEAYKSLREQYPDDMIVFTGSLAFAAYMKKLFLEGKF